MHMFYVNILGIVPIVLGRRNHYEQHVPQFSYIQADQFDSPEQLAAYLHVLDKDSSMYNRYGVGIYQIHCRHITGIL